MLRLSSFFINISNSLSVIFFHFQTSNLQWCFLFVSPNLAAHPLQNRDSLSAVHGTIFLSNSETLPLYFRQFASFSLVRLFRKLISFYLGMLQFCKWYHLLPLKNEYAQDWMTFTKFYDGKPAWNIKDRKKKLKIQVFGLLFSLNVCAYPCVWQDPLGMYWWADRVGWWVGSWWLQSRSRCCPCSAWSKRSESSSFLNQFVHSFSYILTFTWSFL